ncbi:MAG: PIG-L family deacetylase [Chloroflexi bacterium]|nr:PIG-L family deacetylase [Chloroflexota bacterium]
MNFHLPTAQIFVPDGLDTEAALRRTTHMGIGAHQDDLEIMAIDGILRCFGQAEQWFCGVVVTDGRGSPRAGLYAHTSDEQMRQVRIQEQKKAAVIGEYTAQVFLDYPSKVVKTAGSQEPVTDLARLLALARPQIVYTHNLADKHDTHVGVALKVIQAIRSLPESNRPRKLYGCEVWRDLDWLVDSDKVAFDVSAAENVQAALVGVFDSQISGGKRYDLATMGRRRANATYHASHATDESTGAVFAMDLTPLIEDESTDITAFVLAHIERFSTDVQTRIQRMDA